MKPKINWKPSNANLRKFGLTVLLGFGLIGFLVYRRGNLSLAVSVWAISSAVAFLAIVLPPISRPFYALWMGLAFALGSVMSRVVLAVIFYGLLTPVALLFRFLKRDALGRHKPTAPQETYWLDHPFIEDTHYYDHMF